MAVLSLPLSFNNSFWSQDYRKGLEVLYSKLEQGVAENAEIIAFIRARALVEGQLASSLANPMLTGPAGTGFGADDGASLLMAFRGLQAESVAQGKAHASISNELTTLVADPFQDWARAYGDRIKKNKQSILNDWLKVYEQAHADVAKLKQQYLAKIRKADDAEDDIKFAPNVNGATDNYTSSPRLRPVDGHKPPQRTASVSERISQRLKEIQRRSTGALSTASSKLSDDNIAEDDQPLGSKVDKGKGKAVEEPHPVDIQKSPLIASPPPLSPLSSTADDLSPTDPAPAPTAPAPPQNILLAGLSFAPADISKLLTRAAAELPLRPVRFPLLGEYPDAFTGEEFVSWLQNHVPGFDGSLDRAEDAARELTEREGLLRRLGELGNQFEDADDAFYQFRPKAFSFDKPEPVSAGGLGSQQNLTKRAGAFVNLVSKALANNPNGEPAYVRARQEAEDADKSYRVAVRQLDRQRLALEEKIEENLKILQRWEADRLRAIKTVLLQYQGTLANLPKSLEPSLERSSTLVASFQPDSDLNALIERYRTGPFRPHAELYESAAHDECDVVFGIDLRKWAEGGWQNITSPTEEKKDDIPPVLTALLTGLMESYGRLPDDAERRKSWIYEVPLPAVHHLREALNAIPAEKPIDSDIVAKYDAPIVASTIKLWLLELEPPLALYEAWDDLRKLYPTVGAAKQDKEDNKEEHIQKLNSILHRMPRIHLLVLDEIVKHLTYLIENTESEEDNEVYYTKLALSVGRTIVRPKVETELSIQDRHPTLLFIDLLRNYEAILPATIARKKRDSERKPPVRKRTALVDMRVSRSRISGTVDPQQLLAAQQRLKSPPPSAALALSPSTPTKRSPRPSISEVSEKPVPPPPSNFVAPPPPPPIQQPAVPPPPPLNASGPPAFKEPPPEFDDLPPRPAFKEPPPEDDMNSPTPTRPNFVEPPAEDDDDDDDDEEEDDDDEEEDDDEDEEEEEEEEPQAPPAPKAAPPPQTTVIPPTPEKRATPVPIRPSGTVSPAPKEPIRTPSPSVNEDQVLGTGRSSITRAGSGGIRGPRITRGPRPGGGNVSSMVQNLNNRGSISSSPPAPSSPLSPRSQNRLSGSQNPRPSSVLGRSAAFSRRTMDSDAEDHIVDRR